MGGGGSAPPAPDPTATANAQTASNQSNAQFNAVLNRPNITTPYGTQTWTQNGTDPATGAPLWAQNISVSPNAQSAIDNGIAASNSLSQLQQGAVGNVANTIGQPINTSNLAQIQTSLGAGPGQQGINTNGPQVGNGLTNAVNTGGMPGYSTSVNGGNLDGARLQAQNAIYNRQAAMLDPQYANQKQALDSQLANQGITQGSEAYNKAQDAFARQRDFAYGQLRDSAVTGGNDYAQQQFNMGATNAGLNNQARSSLFGEGTTNAGLNNQAQQQGYQNILSSLGFNNAANQTNFANSLSSAQFGNNAAQQQLAQLLQLRNQPLNELSAIRSGSQVQTPQFQGTPTTAANPTDLASLYQNQYNGQLAGYNANVSTNNANTSALSGLASTALMGFMMSDVRTKENIQPVGKTNDGHNIYKYNYKGSDIPQMGVMAQEVMETNPEAVARTPNGLFMVDYDQVH